MTPDPLLAALLEFLRIPSVSSGGGDAAALRPAPSGWPPRSSPPAARRGW